MAFLINIFYKFRCLDFFTSNHLQLSCNKKTTLLNVYQLTDYFKTNGIHNKDKLSYNNKEYFNCNLWPLHNYFSNTFSFFEILVCFANISRSKHFGYIWHKYVFIIQLHHFIHTTFNNLWLLIANT